jgi:hypothetical protein
MVFENIVNTNPICRHAYDLGQRRYSGMPDACAA